MMMTAHVVFAALDPTRPATLSRIWSSTGLLRGKLGFEGVIVSDDLDMKAIRERWSMRDVVRRSARARLDCYLACRDPEVQREAEAALDELVARGEDQGRFAEACARVRKLRATLRTIDATSDWRTLPLDEHAKLAARALTLS